MADRGLEALAMLFLVIVVASLPLVPGQPLRLLGVEILTAGIVTIVAIVPLQRAYLGSTQPAYLRQTSRMVAVNRAAVLLIALAGGVLTGRGDGIGLYLLPPGILLTFIASGANAWVLLIEINR
jgi:hypothetical protein